MLLLACFLLSQGKAQEPIWNVKKQRFLATWKPAGDSIYLICRGTVSKRGFIAHAYNLRDTFATHVGLGWWKGDSFYIHHISNEPLKNGSWLREETLEAFILPDDVYYLAIAPLQSGNINPAGAEALFAEDHAKGIRFDFDFDLQNNSLYCSEWCVSLLSRMDPSKQPYKPVTRPLSNTLAGRLLERESLTYFPVDFFYGHPATGPLLRFRFVE